MIRNIILRLIKNLKILLLLVAVGLITKFILINHLSLNSNDLLYTIIVVFVSVLFRLLYKYLTKNSKSSLNFKFFIIVFISTLFFSLFINTFFIWCINYVNFDIYAISALILFLFLSSGDEFGPWDPQGNQDFLDRWQINNTNNITGSTTNTSNTTSLTGNTANNTNTQLQNPADYHAPGYIRDNGSIIHSKIPKDWDINENYNFPRWNPKGSNKVPATQAAAWMEYSFFVEEKRWVTTHSTENTFNESGRLFFEDFAKYELKEINVKRVLNTKTVRNILRNVD